MKMKYLMNSTLNKIKLSHIVCMLIGVLLTEGITWLLYKDFKKITAPGLSAIVAVIALSLAIYSAYQVKKWVNSKIKEKAFKRTEELLEEISKMAVILARLKYLMMEIKNLKHLSEISASKLSSEIKNQQEKYFESISNQILAVHSFSNWGVIFTIRKIYDKARIHLTHTQNECNHIRDKLNKEIIKAKKNETVNIEEIKFQAKHIISRIDAAGYILDGIIKMKYEKIFKHPAE